MENEFCSCVTMATKIKMKMAQVTNIGTQWYCFIVAIMNILVPYSSWSLKTASLWRWKGENYRCMLIWRHGREGKMNMAPIIGTVIIREMVMLSLKKSCWCRLAAVITWSRREIYPRPASLLSARGESECEIYYTINLKLSVSRIN
jgi:hypothetical protein